MGASRHSTRPDSRDSLTVLLAVNGTTSKRIVSKHGQIEVTGYNAGIWFGVLTYPVDGIASLYAKVAMLACRNDVVVIRGEPAPGIDRNSRAVRRLKLNFPPPPRGRRWIMIDFDKVALPAGIDLARDRAEVLEHLVCMLPPEFHQVTYCWQLSASAGLSDASVVSAHLWFWLNRRIPDDRLKNWAKAWNKVVGRKVIDPALFNSVQLHYVTAPNFEGIPDPFPERCGLRQKKADEVTISIRSNSPNQRDPDSASGKSKSGQGYSRRRQRGKARRWPGRVPQAEAGERNTMLAKLAGHLIARGLPLFGVISRANRWNARNSVPLDEQEVSATCESVWRTHQRNHGRVGHGR